MTAVGVPESLAALSVPIDSVVALPGNPRRGSVPAIVESLQVNGQYRPIVVNSRTNEILAGNHTYAAAVELGWDQIAVTFVDADAEQAARIALVDNRANDLAGYDEAALVALLGSLPDLAGTGFTQEDLAALLAGVSGPGEPLSDPDDVPGVPVAPVTVRGDVWLLGPHRVLCGDCRDHGDVETLLGDVRVNVAFTSPPYAAQRVYDESSGFLPIKPDEYVDWFDAVQANVRAYLADDGSWFVNIKEHAQDGQRNLYVKDLTIAHVRRWGWMFVDELCWHKDGIPGTWPDRFKNGWEPIFHFASDRPGIKFRPVAVSVDSDDVIDYDPRNTDATAGGNIGVYAPAGRRSGLARPSNVLRFGNSSGTSSHNHTAAFPVGLPAWFVRAYSDPGDVVFDPFLGSGSTLIAAHVDGRVGYGMEISPGYVDVICARFQNHTGIKPVLQSTGEPHDFTPAG